MPLGCWLVSRLSAFTVISLRREKVVPHATYEKIKDHEVSKGKYIPLTEPEFESIEAEANKNITLKEFVPVTKVDPVYVKTSYYLGPDKGAEKSPMPLRRAIANYRPPLILA